MKIILNKDVANLGEEGDVREVAPGYARNYLIPKGFGVAYTKQNLALLEGKRNSIEKRKEEKRERAAGLRERIEALSLRISMTVGESGRLFGSVTSAMIAEELSKQGIEIERKRIEIPEHTIKTTGNFVVRVKLYGSEVAELKVVVSGPIEEAADAKKNEAKAPVAEEPKEAHVEEPGVTEEAADVAESDEISEELEEAAVENEETETGVEPAETDVESSEAEAAPEDVEATADEEERPADE